jgi:hypothetical protein
MNLLTLCPFSPDIGEIGTQFRQYLKLGSFDLGVSVTEAEHVIGEGGPRPQVKRCIGLVPLDMHLAYYSNIDAVIARLNAAALRLVAQYNANKVKKTLEWREDIGTQSWTSRTGKVETTQWQQELSTFNFHKHRHQLPKARPMTVADVKVRNWRILPLVDICCSPPSDQIGGFFL